MEKIYQEIEFWLEPQAKKAFSRSEIEEIDKRGYNYLIPCTVELWLELNTETGYTYIDNIEYKNLEIHLDKMKILKTFIQTFDKKTLDNLIDEAIFQYERE